VAAYTIPLVDVTLVLVWRVLSWSGCLVVFKQLLYVICRSQWPRGLKVPIHVRVWLASPPRGAWLGSQARIYSVTSVHERPCSRTSRFTNKFSEQKSLGWRTVSRITNTQAGNSGKLRISERECQLLVNLVSVYEHFGSRTASRNELSSWTEVPLYMYMYVCMYVYIYMYI
jgi:hypothetical protein